MKPLRVKVENMRSSSGNDIPNQFLIFTEDGTYFQSYKTVIVASTDNGVFLDKNYWDYSKTTGKYRNMYLGESKKETEKKIKMGIYKLIDLNGDGK